MQRHKDAPDLLRHLLQPGDQVRVLALPEHASWSADELASVLPGIEAGSDDLREDLEWLVQSEGLPVACGSLYLVAALLPLLDPTD
jgi:dihydrofolate synthase/folylpolyglutamate synthase